MLVSPIFSGQRQSLNLESTEPPLSIVKPNSPGLGQCDKQQLFCPFKIVKIYNTTMTHNMWGNSHITMGLSMCFFFFKLSHGHDVDGLPPRWNTVKEAEQLAQKIIATAGSGWENHLSWKWLFKSHGFHGPLSENRSHFFFTLPNFVNFTPIFWCLILPMDGLILPFL